MHQYGRLATAGIATLEAPAGAPPPPWRLPGATIQQVTFEVDWDAALDAMPDIMSRPVPPYARLWVCDYPDSPAGPYREALLLLSARYFLLPRHIIVASVVTAEAAQAANAEHWRYRSEVGGVALDRSEDGFAGRIDVPGGPRITIDSPRPMQTGTAVIRYDPLVVVQPGEEGQSVEDGQPDGGSPRVLNVAPTLGVVHDAWLARDTRVTYEGGEPSSPWLRLRSRNFITCTVGLHDLERGEAAEVRRPQPGAGGGLP